MQQKNLESHKSYHDVISSMLLRESLSQECRCIRIGHSSFIEAEEGSLDPDTQNRMFIGEPPTIFTEFLKGRDIGGLE